LQCIAMDCVFGGDLGVFGGRWRVWEAIKNN